jgi:hypothetical protein
MGVYIAKSNRINPNLVAAGGSLVVGDSAPRGGDAPGERKRINPNSVEMAPGSASIADKVSADELNALAVKAADRGDQEGSLALLRAEKTMRSGDATSRDRAVQKMAQQTAVFFKRQGIQGIETAAPESKSTEFRKSLLSSVESKRKAVVMSLLKAAARERDSEKKARFEKQAREVDRLDLSRPENLTGWMKQNRYAAAA